MNEEQRHLHVSYLIQQREAACEAGFEVEVHRLDQELAKFGYDNEPPARWGYKTGIYQPFTTEVPVARSD
jgi:hypothetical protein